MKTNYKLLTDVPGQHCKMPILSQGDVVLNRWVKIQATAGFIETVNLKSATSPQRLYKTDVTDLMHYAKCSIIIILVVHSSVKIAFLFLKMAKLCMLQVHKKWSMKFC